MSGHHENIRKWRLTESLAKTLRLRPDLLASYDFDEEASEIVRQLQKADDIK